MAQTSPLGDFMAALIWFVLTFCAARGQDGDAEKASSSAPRFTTSVTPGLDAGNTTTEPSRFLKHGDTYDGRVATRVIELADASVAVLLTIDNWSKWALVDPVLTMECGRMVENQNREDLGLPQIIKPGYSEMILFEKNPGLNGVCGVLAFTLEVALDEAADFLQVMFSVPYNLNTYGAYFAVGVSQDYLNNETDVFRDLYYYAGPFRRAEAGSMVQFSSQRVLVRGTLTPDTYKPILSLVVLPLEKEDQFVPGEYYSPRLRAAAFTRTANAETLALALSIAWSSLSPRNEIF